MGYLLFPLILIAIVASNLAARKRGAAKREYFKPAYDEDNHHWPSDEESFPMVKSDRTPMVKIDDAPMANIDDTPMVNIDGTPMITGTSVDVTGKPYGVMGPSFDQGLSFGSSFGSDSSFGSHSSVGSSFGSHSSFD